MWPVALIGLIELMRALLVPEVCFGDCFGAPFFSLYPFPGLQPPFLGEEINGVTFRDQSVALIAC